MDGIKVVVICEPLVRYLSVIQKEYKTPPIKEALFVITHKEPVSVDQLTDFVESDYIKRKYEIKSHAFRLEATLSGPPKTEVRSSQAIRDGFLLQSRETNRRIRLTADHVSYHNFDKYVGWNVMFSEFKSLWREYCNAVSCGQVNKISVRYINEIALPQPVEDFGTYLNLLPHLPDGIGEVINGFFMQIDVNSRDNELRGIVTQTTRMPDQSNVLVLLDIIVDKNVMLNCDDGEIWDTFLRIRTYKNHLFEECITPETKKMFDT